MTHTTTSDPTQLPAFTDADFDTAHAVIIRTIAQHQVDETLTPAEAHRRIAALTPRMPPAARANAVEQLVGALERLDDIRSDMWAGTDTDRLGADLDADADAEDAIRKLVAGAR